MKNIFYLLIIICLAACNEPKKAEVLTLPEGEIPHLPKAIAANNPATAAKPGTINPPHGEPGHTCAVAVGALIPSVPNGAVSNLTPQQQIQQQLAAQQGNMQTAPAVTNNAPVINPNDSSPNPEHGKPKHRCDIPVGAPLNSKPGAAPAVQTASTATAKGMNPPHGQPGHRCDIAVGAPLNGKPAPVVAQAPVVTPPVAPTEPVKIEQANGGVRN